MWIYLKVKYPIFIFEYPIFIFEYPIFIFEYPIFIFEYPIFIFEYPIFIFEYPIFIFEYPIFIFEYPIFLFEYLIFLFEYPIFGGKYVNVQCSKTNIRNEVSQYMRSGGWEAWWVPFAGLLRIGIETFYDKQISHTLRDAFKTKQIWLESRVFECFFWRHAWKMHLGVR
jgi:hypothetical protein